MGFDDCWIPFPFPWPGYNSSVIRLAISLSLALTVCFVACTSHPSLEAKPETKPEARLIGKWEEVPLTKKRHTLVQFEYLGDGSLIENEKTLAAKWWQQQGTGTYKFIDANHIKVELQPAWYFGVVIYEILWLDKDRMALRAADEAIPLARVKPAETR